MGAQRTENFDGGQRRSICAPSGASRRNQKGAHRSTRTFLGRRREAARVAAAPYRSSPPGWKRTDAEGSRRGDVRSEGSHRSDDAAQSISAGWDGPRGRPGKGGKKAKVSESQLRRSFSPARPAFVCRESRRIDSIIGRKQSWPPQLPVTLNHRSIVHPHRDTFGTALHFDRKMF